MMSSRNPHNLLPDIPVLDLIQKLCSNQINIESSEQLIDFLHREVFPGFAPCRGGIYMQQAGTHLYSSQSPKKGGTPAPEFIDIDKPDLYSLKQSHTALFLSSDDESSTPFSPEENHLLVPVPGGDSPIGLLYFSVPPAIHFADDTIKAITLLASVVAAKLQSMSTISELKRSMADVEYAEQLRKALHEISQRTQNASDINKLYEKLHRIVAKVIHAPNFYVALITDEADGKYVQFPYYADEHDPQYQGVRERYEDLHPTLTTTLYEFRNVLLLTPKNFDTICSAHNINFRGSHPQSWLGAPFYLDELAGVVVVQSYGDVVYNDKDKELIAFVARQLAGALHRNLSMEELKRAKIKAENAEKNKSTFLANMSHEIRTPMNGIIGLTDLVLQSDISDQHRTYLEMVSTSADRLLKLINDILDFSKIDAGKLELDICPFSLRDVLANGLEILAISAAKKNLDLQVFCDPHLPDGLIGDGYKLSQILINLISNGIKFTASGSVSITVEKSPRVQCDDSHIPICFSVRDTGIGIPQDEIEKVFQAFNQLSTTRDSNHRGTGLGLVIAAELVEIMGGRIDVSSREGIGTCFQFTLTFPVHNKAHPALFLQKPEENLRVSGMQGKKLRILLAEDELINRTLALSVLEKEGWTVNCAENGVDAVRMYREGDFDLILMDIQMPQQNGYESTKIIRELEKSGDSHIPIIAMTAYAVKGDREKCLAAGMDGYVSKPINTNTLYYEIQKVVQHVSGAVTDATK